MVHEDPSIAGPVSADMAQAIQRPAITDVKLDSQNYCHIGHYRWKVDPEYVTYAFPKDAKKSILVKCEFDLQKRLRVFFQPLWISKNGQPLPLGQSDSRSEDVLNYIKWLCEDQGLNTQFVREGNDIRVVTE